MQACFIGEKSVNFHLNFFTKKSKNTQVYLPTFCDSIIQQQGTHCSMNTNELINADLFPRNVPKPSSFHENTLKPEVPEVSLMFENGFQYNKVNDTNKQALLERAINNSMKMPAEAVGDRASSGLGPSNPTDSRKGLFSNRGKSKSSTPHRHSKSDKIDSTKSSSDETDLEKQTFQENKRRINTESHLIEPVESYSVWKYKNQHMFVENEQAIPKKAKQYDSPDFRNHELQSSQPPFRTKSDDNQQQAFQKEMRHYYFPEFRNEELKFNKPHYRSDHDEQDQEIRMAYIQKSPFDHDPSNHRVGLPKYLQEHHNPSVEFYRKNVYKTREDQLESPNLTEKSNWRPPRMNFDTSEPVARCIETSMPHQRKTTDNNNSVSEFCKVVEFQNKHIEFLNEQIYTLTLQNKTLSNLTKHIKMLEDAQTKQSEVMQENFNQLQETILNAIETNNKPSSSTARNKLETFGENNIEHHLEKMEKKLVELINSKMIVNNELKNIPCDTDNQNDVENETSSTEDPVTAKYKHTTSKQCKCSYDSAQPCKKYKTKSNQKSPIVKTDHRNNATISEQQIDVMKYNAPVANEWECQPGHSKQIISKKQTKKSQRKPDQVEKLAMNQPVLYYQQMYQADKFASNNRRASQGEKLKKDNIKSRLEEKLNPSQRKKTMKSKSQHFAKGNYRAENTLMNDEHSLTLNARELPVINEHIPSPEASVHIDMADYQSSSSEFDDSDEENRQLSTESNEEEDEEGRAPWPTFYNNVVGKVHKLLQVNQQSEEPAADIPDDQYRTVQVRMATIDQFKKMGISFVDDSPNGKRVTFNKNKNKLNQHPETHMGEAAKRSPLTAVCNTNLSFASLQYLQRYHLLPTPNMQIQEPIHHESNLED